MSNFNSNPNQSQKPLTRVIGGRRYVRKVVGHRLVPMEPGQVDDVARAEGRGQSPNVVAPYPRCPWCFLKGGSGGKHTCMRRTGRAEQAEGGRIRQVPIHEWVPEE